MRELALIFGALAKNKRETRQKQRELALTFEGQANQ